MKTFGEDLTLEGQTKPLREWAEILGLRPDTLWHRVKRGWSDKRILTEGLYGRKNKRPSTMPDMSAQWKAWAQYEGLHPKPRPKDLQV